MGAGDTTSTPSTAATPATTDATPETTEAALADLELLPTGPYDVGVTTITINAETDSEPLVRVELVDAQHQSFTDVCDYQMLLPTLGDAVPAPVIETIDAQADEGCTDVDMPIDRARELTNTFAINFLESIFRDAELISDANTALPDDIIFMSR